MVRPEAGVNTQLHIALRTFLPCPTMFLLILRYVLFVMGMELQVVKFK